MKNVTSFEYERNREVHEKRRVTAIDRTIDLSPSESSTFAIPVSLDKHICLENLSGGPVLVEFLSTGTFFSIFLQTTFVGPLPDEVDRVRLSSESSNDNEIRMVVN